MVAAPPTFDDWLGWMFDPRLRGPAFAFADGVDLDLGPERELRYVTETFEDAGELLGRFADADVAKALWYLAGGGGLYLACEPALPLEDRLRCIRSTTPLFRDYFAQRCVEQASAGSREEVSPLNTICYMWWDVGPLPGDAVHVDTCLDVLEETLALPHVACQESALHGLGHLRVHGVAEARRQEIVERYLAGRTPGLEEYARVALDGCVQ